jgi:hypothetical protein
MIATAALSIRRSAGSTELAEAFAVEWAAGFSPTGGHHLLLIHGFNNTHDEARLAYATFRQLLTDAGLAAQSLVEVHWPGNARLGLLSFASYPTEIRPAVASGRALAAWLMEKTGQATFTIVAHSLGCRLALEAVNHLRAAGALGKIEDMCLMAAAVRVDRVAKGVLGPQPFDSTGWRILHSRNDWVLGLAFPLGQTLAGDGFFPRAVGVAGDPDVWPEDVPGLGYGHGGYWRGGGESDDELAITLPAYQPLVPRRPARGGDNASARWVANLIDAALPKPRARHELLTAPTPPSHATPRHASLHHGLMAAPA